MIFQTNLKGHWDILNEGGQFRSITFINDSIGWIAGDGIFLKTEDGGNTWNKIILNDNINIHKVNFTDENLGWAITRNNYDPCCFDRDTFYILKTEDGGATWTIQKELPATYLEELQVVNDSTVYISAFTGSWGDPIPKFLKTVDGGDSWIEIPRNENLRKYQSIWFQDVDNGIFVGTEYDEVTNPIKGIILRTTDGGATFDETLIDEYREIFDLQIINDSTGYFSAGENVPNGFYMTNDTLHSWTQLSNTNMFINAFSYVNDTTIFAVMNTDYEVKLMKSSDGGLTWKQKFPLEWFDGGWFYWDACKIHFRNKDTGFVVGGSPSPLTGDHYILQTLDGGNKWEIQKIWTPLEYVYFLNRYNGFVYGGSMLSTYDGGNHWEFSPNNPPGSIREMGFINDLIRFSLSYFYYDGFQIYKTIDGGSTWYNVFKSNRDSLGIGLEGYDIDFLDDNTAFVVGKFETDTSRGSVILGTTEGGENWDLVWKSPEDIGFTDNQLNSIHTVGTKAWAVGESGLIVKYTEQDQWQIQPSFTDLSLSDVFFSDTQHGWIRGGNSSLFRTINSGQTWIEKQFDEYFIFDIYFADSLYGWAVGSDTIFYSTGVADVVSGKGVILNTFNGGENWSVQVEDLSAPINAIHFNDGYLWAVGGNGLILKSDITTDIWIDENNKKIRPARYSLSQNYPNPFNPSTTIEFDLPNTSDVRIEVYNIAGQKVQTLLNEKIAAGSHKVEFNAQNLSSGVYFYKIEAGEFQDVKKMILIK